LPPHSPPFLITAAPHSLHHYHRHFPVVPPKPDRQLLPMHPMHNQSKPSSKGIQIRRPSSMKAAGLALINCTEILTQCSVTRETLRGHPLFGYSMLLPTRGILLHPPLLLDFPQLSICATCFESLGKFCTTGHQNSSLQMGFIWE
jgi:hypothetical protein